MTTRLLRATALACCLAVLHSQPSAAVSASATQHAAPVAASGPRHDLTAAQWREDLRFMAAEMERRHANLFHTVSREAFAAAVKDLHDRIPGLQRNQIIVGMMRIAAMVGDGHTRIDPRKDPMFGFPSFPLRLYLFEDGLYVRAAARQHADLVGARIEAIGGVPVEEAIRRASEISSRDNEIGPKLFVPIYLNMPDILHALGLSSGGEAASFTLSKGGRTWSVQVPAGEVEPLWPPDTDISLTSTPQGWVDARRTPKPPLWLEAPLDYHRLEEMPERRAIYVQLNMVTNVEGQTLARFAERIGERVRATNPRALLLDLRLNQGGNGDLRTRLVQEFIKAEDGDTRLLVLTWRGTFSASQFILDDLDRLTDAVFVGEPASSKPSSYGDAYRTPMPNSRIAVRSSIVWWQAGQNKDPWTWVDVAAPLTFADYAAGRDPALEAALASNPRPSLADQVDQARGVADLERILAADRADPTRRYADRQQDLITAAVRLSRAERHDEALFVAEAATRQFPRSATAFSVLAQLAERAGRAGLARRAGQRVLELDPNDRVIRSLMERLPA